MSGKENKIGKAGEELARGYLERFGVMQLEKIGTPVIVIRDARGKITNVIFAEEVAADFRGIIPGGRSVMAEVKTVEHNLRWSDFKDHQPGKLSEHSELGGLSLVVWVHSSGVYLLEWEIDGFGPGSGLTPDDAQRLDLSKRYYE